jgi:hypothetical protein
MPEQKISVNLLIGIRWLCSLSPGWNQKSWMLSLRAELTACKGFSYPVHTGVGVIGTMFTQSMHLRVHPLQ